MITFRKEPFWQALEDAAPLLPRHFDEIAENKEILGRPDPDLDRYRILDATGKLHTLVARDGARLVGYFVCITDNALHYRTIRAGSEDLYYLAPEYRGRPGFQLILEAERMMRELGVQVATMKTKEANNKGPVLERLGWRPFERVYCKVLA